MANEAEMIIALLGDERLSEKEQKAFKDMEDFLAANKHRKLSNKQYKWIEAKFEQLDLGSGESLNLFSTGQVPKGSYTKSSVTLPWEKPGYKKLLKPPR